MAVTVATFVSAMAQIWVAFTRQTVLEVAGSVIGGITMPLFYPYGFVVFGLAVTVLHVLVWIAFMRVRRTSNSTDVITPIPPPPHGSIKWITDEERRQEHQRQVEQQTTTQQIPSGEFELSTKTDKHGHLHVRVHNCKDEPKTGYFVRLTNLRIWSDKLNAIGGFARYPPFVDHGKPIDLIEGAGSIGRLEHVAPSLFELVHNHGSAPWFVRDNKQNRVLMKDGVWLFEGELHWNGGVMPFTYHIRLNSDKHSKTAEVVSWDAPQGGGRE